MHEFMHHVLAAACGDLYSLIPVVAVIVSQLPVNQSVVAFKLSGVIFLFSAVVNAAFLSGPRCALNAILFHAV